MFWMRPLTCPSTIELGIVYSLTTGMPGMSPPVMPNAPQHFAVYIYSIKPQCWQKRGKIPLFGTHQAENSGVQWALERTGKYQDFLLEIREKDGGEIEEGG